MRKPWFEPEYIACTCAATLHWRQPELPPEPTVAAGPVVDGWFVQLTPPSFQAPFRRTASMVRPSLTPPAKRRSVAESTTQPAGAAGRSKRTSARRLESPSP